MGVLPKLFKVWPWVDLDPFYAKVKFGHIGFCENHLFFGTYCSFRSQSCLKYSAKWVYEVEWVSKVNVILWSWSKVTQVSKLNVWLLACILRWAIQDLRALLFLCPQRTSGGIFKSNRPSVRPSVHPLQIVSQRYLINYWSKFDDTSQKDKA